MSEAAERRIAELEEALQEAKQETRVAQELLAAVLVEHDAPVVLKIDELEAATGMDRFIDLQLDDEERTWTLQVVHAGVA